MKRFFHAELDEYRSNIILMAERCIDSVRSATKALFEGDSKAAQATIESDDIIDRLEVVLDSEAIRYISTRAPVAKDLRLLTVGMKVAHDLERVGDEATSIARRVIKLQAALPVNNFLHIPEITSLALEMLRDSVDAFVEGDLVKAKSVPVRDQRVDDLNKENYRQFAQQIVADPSQVNGYLDLMFVSKSIERIADHATNIAEEVYYLCKGEDVRHLASFKEGKGTES